MNRRAFFGVGLGAVLAGNVPAAAAPSHREYSPAGKALLAQRDELADAANAHSAAGRTREYADTVAAIRAVERQLIAVENPR